MFFEVLFTVFAFGFVVVSRSSPSNVARPEPTVLSSAAAATFAVIDFVTLVLMIPAGINVTAIRHSAASASSVKPCATPENAPALVGGIGRSLDGSSVGAGHVGSLVSLLADDDIEFDELAVADTSDGLLRVVLSDRGLVDENVFLGVVAIDEAVARLDIEPLDGAGDLLCDDLLWLLLFSVGG